MSQEEAMEWNHWASLNRLELLGLWLVGPTFFVMTLIIMIAIAVFGHAFGTKEVLLSVFLIAGGGWVIIDKTLFRLKKEHLWWLLACLCGLGTVIYVFSAIANLMHLMFRKEPLFSSGVAMGERSIVRRRLIGRVMPFLSGLGLCGAITVIIIVSGLLSMASEWTEADYVDLYEATTPTSLTASPSPASTPTSVAMPEPVTVRVAPDGSGDYPSLEAAVDAVPMGSTIILEPGTYRLARPLDIRKSLSLAGAGMDQTEIVSEAKGYVVRFSGDGSFIAENITFRHQGTAEADVVVVEGGEIAFARCRFTGAVYIGGERDRAGLWLEGSMSGVVRDCVVVENDTVGIQVEDQAQPTLEENVCTDNEQAGIGYFDNAGGVARQNKCSGNAMGICVGEQAQPTLKGNACTDNEVAGIGYFDNAGGVARQNECSGNTMGICVKDQAQPTLEGNACTDNELVGIAYIGSTGGVARQNECSGNGVSGIDVGEQAQPTLEGNVCKDNEMAGIDYFGSAGGVARQNECSGNGKGINIDEQAQPTLERNVCTDNKFGISYEGDAGGMARQNECSGNQWGIGVDEQAQPTLEGNVCTDNLIGIIYAGNAGGVARQNECSGNKVGIGVGETADPDLVDNDCHDNTEEDIRDLRP